MSKSLNQSAENSIAQTQRWVEEIVLGHNFCPFAHKPARSGTIRYAASPARAEQNLVDDLIAELCLLRDTDQTTLETTILVAPFVLADFLAYNQFLDVVDSLLDELEMEGVIQVASFHPQYQFADLAPDDVRNYTNRSPYPLFHLIREDSVAQARATYPDVASIPTRNMAYLEQLGLAEAKARLAACTEVVEKPRACD